MMSNKYILMRKNKPITMVELDDDGTIWFTHREYREDMGDYKWRKMSYYYGL